jgi:hypothetical protein
LTLAGSGWARSPWGCWKEKHYCDRSVTHVCL